MKGPLSATAQAYLKKKEKSQLNKVKYFMPKSKILPKKSENNFHINDFIFGLVANTRILFWITDPISIFENGIPDERGHDLKISTD